jgi:hypothetical protein
MPRNLGVLLLIALGLRTPVFAEINVGDPGILIQKAQIIERDGHKLVTAEIEYRFPEVALKALEEGIPLSFKVCLKVGRLGLLGWPETLTQEERTIQLRYQPLAKSYQVSDLGSGVVVHYASLATVLDTLSHLRGWLLPELPPQEAGEKREASLSFSFDVEALPLPLRLVAYISPEWKINTPAYRWQLDP